MRKKIFIFYNQFSTGVNLSNHKKGDIIKIYFQSKNNLVNVLLEESALLVTEVLLIIIKICCVGRKI